MSDKQVEIEKEEPMPKIIYAYYDYDGDDKYLCAEKELENCANLNVPSLVGVYKLDEEFYAQAKTKRTIHKVENPVFISEEPDTVETDRTY